MLSFAFRRLLWALPTLLGVTLVCFVLLQLAGGDPVTSGLGVAGLGAGRDGAVDRVRALYGLDQPWYVQYGELLIRFVTLDLGTRWLDGRPVVEVLSEALPVTLVLALSSLALSYAIAIPLGVYSAVRRGGVFDRTMTAVLFLLYAAPSYWLGMVGLIFLASGRYVDCEFTASPGCFPLQGLRSPSGHDDLSLIQQMGDVIWHLVLPVATLSCARVSVVSRYMRTAMLDVLQSDYIRAARAKGLSERAVVWGHALRNGLLSIVTLFGLNLPALMSGAVLVESIFGLRGIGLVTLEGIRLPDYPLVITSVGLTGALTVVSVFVSDLLYAALDPRIRHAVDGEGE